MKLEEQVVSLELAKKLKELGVLQKSVLNWASTTTEDKKSKYGLRWVHEIRQGGIIGKYDYSAFTVAELGEMLPQGYSSWWHAKQDGQGTTLYCCADSHYDDSIVFEDNTEADARAKMLIYLIENKLI